MVKHRVARFFLVQTYQNENNIPNIRNGRKIFQMVIKYNNILYSQAHQILQKLVYLVETNHLATLANHFSGKTVSSCLEILKFDPSLQFYAHFRMFG
jgi:hypothetical protein